ncbi:hypothetical protein JCM11641_008449 [Rhodosporidiobolus odoratus]
MSQKFGDYFAAQQAFNETCSQGLTISQYCAAPQDVCCGLCNVIPISGFGTFLSFSVGSFMNLLFAMWWKPEIPWNTGLQFITTDAIILSLIDRFFEPKNRLSLFHYCFVPLSALSAIPILVACSLARLKHLRNTPSAEAKRLKEEKRLREEEEAKRTQAQNDGQAISSHAAAGDGQHLSRAGSSRHSRHSRHGDDVRSMASLFKPPWKGRQSSDQFSSSGHPRRNSNPPDHGPDSDPPGKRPGMRHSAHTEPPHNAALRRKVRRPVSFVDKKNADLLPNKQLPYIVRWVCLLHLILYALVFVVVFAAAGNFNQQNCNDQYDLQQFRLRAGIMCAVFLIIGGIFLSFLWVAVTRAGNGDNDAVNDGLQVLFEFTFRSLHSRWADRHMSDKTLSNRWRWCIPLFVFSLWVFPYIGIYFWALQTFLMQGSNPWPYEQVNAAFSVFVPLVLVFRAWLEHRTDWENKHGVPLNAERDAQRQIDMLKIVTKLNARAADGHHENDGRARRPSTDTGVSSQGALHGGSNVSPHATHSRHPVHLSRNFSRSSDDGVRSPPGAFDRQTSGFPFDQSHNPVRYSTEENDSIPDLHRHPSYSSRQSRSSIVKDLEQAYAPGQAWLAEHASESGQAARAGNSDTSEDEEEEESEEDKAARRHRKGK